MTVEIHQRIAAELNVAQRQVTAAVDLLDGGATVPFVARYRKEATGALDDAQLRTLDERLRYLRELTERRSAVLDSISEQGKLTDELKAQILAADTKARLEDLYLPYKPKRRTKAQIAREAGLEPLADQLLTQPELEPHATAADFVNPEHQVADSDAALAGARAILTERFAEDADLLAELRERMWTQGQLKSTARDGATDKGVKFSDYFDFAEPFSTLPSHRVLALFRGEKEDVLSLALEPSREETTPDADPYVATVAARFDIADHGRPADRWLWDTARWAWRTKISVSVTVDTRMRLWQAAESEAVNVFASNLRDLLLAAPAGARTTMGLDPAYRTGVKVAVVDATGKVVDTTAVYPHKPQGRWDEALATLGALVQRHNVELVAVGNGTASRETDKLAGELTKLAGERKVSKMMVSEAGASVYSASAYASKELPDLDVSLRGAVSIARRMQDPLAELVKIDPKSIGVGQYQHDLAENKLSRSLDAVVEDCVNAVGVDLNTASAPLLARVSGVSTTLADSIVSHRDSVGAFDSRKALRDVPRLGPKAFEQCAGFLRIRGGADPLDASSVHPEAYPLVRRIVESVDEGVDDVIGNGKVLSRLRPGDFVDEAFGLPTVTDILAELEKPGRDPRPEFSTAAFAEGVESIGDLSPGMVLEGVVTNVAAFGAFVDVGVHQDGLVHISAMSNRFVSDPREVAKSGDVVKVRVVDVDAQRSRISLTMRLDDEVASDSGNPRHGERGKTGGGKDGKKRGDRDGGKGRGGKQSAPADGAMADALRRAGLA